MTQTLSTLDDIGRAALFTQARTVNSFADTPVSDDELAAIWDLAKWPPTAANTQPLRVLYVRTAEGRARLVEHMAEGNKAKTANAPAVAVLARDTQFHEFIPTVMPFMPQLKDAYAGNDTMRNDDGEYNAAMQAGYFILAARAQGLATGPMKGFDAAAINADFFPDGRWHTTLVVNLGHPGGAPGHDRLPRLDTTEILRWA